MDTAIYPMDPDLNFAVLCDLDGTLAHFTHHRGPFEHLKCERDTIDDAVREVLIAMYERGDDIILMSGRKNEARAATVRWLARHEVPWTALYMRADDDNRKDSIVKRELFEANIRGRYNVRIVLDDRQQVVDMWRNDLGLKVFQVAEGNF